MPTVQFELKLSTGETVLCSMTGEGPCIGFIGGGPGTFYFKGLEKAGLPREPVNRLTRLFESVRYGARTSAQSDVDEAIACLTSILKYCGEAV
jgi:hypothetical protein